MEAKDFADIIRLVRRAPLQNMDEAEAINGLLQRFAEHAEKMTIETPKPELQEVK